MNSMDERKLRILEAIINDYILTAVPVGSRTISKKYDMGLSSATIRNEMSDLEELGYLDQPHVSAGRIPSAKAYRLYVDELLRTKKLTSSDDDEVRAHFAGRARQMGDVIDHAAQVLSGLTHYTAIVLPPHGHEPKVQTIQLVPVSSVSALVIIVTDSGIVRDTVIRVSDSLDSDTLYAISRMLTGELRGLPLSEAAKHIPEVSARLRQNEEVLSGVHDLLRNASVGSSHVAVGGTSNMLSYPEYNDVEKARGFLSLIESRDKLASLMATQGGTFTVRIGPETGVPEMQDCSIVTATYSTGTDQAGTIGVIGPTRMQYSRVLSVMSTMGRQLSQLLQNGEPEDPI